jgi:hypothetical protein
MTIAIVSLLSTTNMMKTTMATCPSSTSTPSRAWVQSP